MQIEDIVKDTQFHRFPDTTVVVCCLTLENGYCVTGSSQSCPVEEFDEDYAQAWAREEAAVEALKLNAYWLAGLRTLTSEAAAEAAVAKLG